MENLFIDFFDETGRCLLQHLLISQCSIYIYSVYTHYSFIPACKVLYNVQFKGPFQMNLTPTFKTKSWRKLGPEVH